MSVASNTVHKRATLEFDNINNLATCTVCENLSVLDDMALDYKAERCSIDTYYQQCERRRCVIVQVPPFSLEKLRSGNSIDTGTVIDLIHKL